MAQHPEEKRLRAFIVAYDAWQVGKVTADEDGDWLRIAPLYDAMIEARSALRSFSGEERSNG